MQHHVIIVLYVEFESHNPTLSLSTVSMSNCPTGQMCQKYLHMEMEYRIEVKTQISDVVEMDIKCF